MSEKDKLHEIIAQVYERRKSAISVSPSWLATEAMLELDPERVSPELVYRAAHLQLRQIARQLCGQRWDKNESGREDQHELFPDLQQRYPIARSAHQQEPEYVQLERLSFADIQFNVKRLRAESDAKAKHADSLEAYGRNKFASGVAAAE